MRMPDEADAKKILAASALDNWRRPLQSLHNYYVAEDYPAGPEIQWPLSKHVATDMATLEIDVYIWRYALLVLHTRNRNDNNDDDECMKKIWTRKKHKFTDLCHDI